MYKEKQKTITLKVSENTMNKMTEYFQDKKRPKTPPYAVFQADEADTVVTLYNSGKARLSRYKCRYRRKHVEGNGKTL